ncbi:MAG: cation transporter [Nitriliruptoraceae bacterium]
MPQRPTPEPAAHLHAGDHEQHGHDHNVGLSGRLRTLAPHSHDVTDQLDDALASSERGIRITKLTLLILLATAFFQLAIALVRGSVALLGDTIHNVSDAMTSIPLIAFLLGPRAHSKIYPYGYRRAEDLAVIVAVIGTWLGLPVLSSTASSACSSPA